MKGDIEVTQRVFELKNKIFTPRLESAFKSTVCFFENHDKKIVYPAGSGVFIEYQSEYYVISAAHVLAEFYNDTFVMLQDKELVLGGRLVFSEIPESGNRDDDKIDIAILKLCETSISEMLKNLTPVKIDSIELNHELDKYKTYFSVGFPQTRTGKVWNEDRIKSIGYTYQSEPDFDFEFSKHGFIESNVIPLKFDGEVRNASNPHPHLSPKMEGISGSGLWHLFNGEGISLIGIAIQRINEPDNKVILFTKIDVVISMIKEMNK